MTPGPVPGLRGAATLALPMVEDARGALSFGEAGRHLPFAPQRYFLITGVGPHNVRGDHAHERSRQVLICAAGSCRIELHDGRNEGSVDLRSPGVGLLLEPGVWRRMRDFAPGTALLVLCSDHYDPDEYVRDFAAFVAAADAP